ncbi:MAG: hypothetical protein GF331_14165 [Chitinivibrionales bacterium]|nr:hypothetical protein [Chitinivibrionales bacterium]
MTKGRTVAFLAALCCAGAAQAVTVDVATTYQTIDGFGFFGPQTVWWGSSSPSAFYSDGWLATVIDTLGTTIWRNEYYSEESNQDANWAKQLPAVTALYNKAVASGNPLKFIYSVWSPPSAMKCQGSNGCWGNPTSTPHPDGLKHGGTLCTDRHQDFADWLIEGIRKHEQAGIDLYALSFQNEPAFCQYYNSCFYSYGYYTAVLAAIGPTIRAAYPNVKIFGAEHMLSANIHDGRSQFRYIYESNIMRNPDALEYLDIWAYHGYSDGVNPIPGSEMATLWSLVRDSLARATGRDRPVWMTETSGYDDTWGAGGAQELAAAMFAALQYGNLAGWVHWYGADNWIDGNNNLTKRGHVAKHYSRFLRPGAVRVNVGPTGNDNVHVLAFTHDELNNFVVLALNTGGSSYNLSLTGSGVPSSFTHYRTSSADNCADLGTVQAGAITLTANSLNTLVNGSVHEGPTSIARARTPFAAPAPLAGRSPVYSLDGRRVGEELRGLNGKANRVLVSRNGLHLSTPGSPSSVRR